MTASASPRRYGTCSRRRSAIYSSCFRYSWGAIWEYPWKETEPTIVECLEKVGAKRLIWGTDLPMVARFCTYRQLLDQYRVHCNVSDRRRTGGDTRGKRGPSHGPRFLALLRHLDQLLHGAELARRVHYTSVVAPGYLGHVDVALLSPRQSRGENRTGLPGHRSFPALSWPGPRRWCSSP